MKTKYSPLEQYLKHLPQSTREANLTFAEVERIIEGALPKSAHEFREWWANESGDTRHVQSKSWRRAGFYVDQVQQRSSGGSVRFCRR
ncbi:MAG: hypothetical protein WD044_16985 [Dongiaceae bacterium]